MLSNEDLALLESYIKEFRRATKGVLLPEALLTLKLIYLSDADKGQITKLAAQYGYVVDYPSVSCREGTMLMRFRIHVPTTQTFEFGALTIVLSREGKGSLYMTNWFNLNFLTNKCNIWRAM